MSQETRRRLAARERLADRDTPLSGELELPDFARGQDHLEHTHVGRFSTGQETLPELAQGKDRVGRFDQGQDAAPEPPNNLHVGRFSEGVAARPAA